MSRCRRTINADVFMHAQTGHAIVALALDAIMGAFWTITYFECIRIGFKYKTCAMPLFALTLNLSWELLYTAWRAETGRVGLLLSIDALWAALDVIVAYTYVRYATATLSKQFSALAITTWIFFAFATSISVQIAFFFEFGRAAESYSSFLQNLIMSILFIDLYIRRHGPAGQSLIIAVTKCIGTFAATVLYGGVYGHSFVLIVGTLTFISDLAYIVILKYGIPERSKIYVNDATYEHALIIGESPS
jgi:hypothetical protein